MLIFPGVLFSQTATPAAKSGVIRVACVGDSITKGYHLANALENCYPARLGKLLGDRYEVKNFGANVANMMEKGASPYMKRPEFQAALDFKPDILIVALGTNDSRPANVPLISEDFMPSYEELIRKFRAVNPAVKIYAALPTPAYAGSAEGISDNTITGKIIPKIRDIAQEDGKITIIDFHTPLENKEEYFSDKLHPDEKGTAVMAETACKAITGSRN